MEFTQEMKIRLLREIAKYNVINDSGERVVRRVYAYDIEQQFDLKYLRAGLDILQKEGLIAGVDLAHGITHPLHTPSDGLQVFVRQDMSLGLLTEAGQRLLDTSDHQAQEDSSQDNEKELLP